MTEEESDMCLLGPANGFEVHKEVKQCVMDFFDKFLLEKSSPVLFDKDGKTFTSVCTNNKQ